MTTIAQPAAGTALPSTSLTSGLVFARNEADTTAGTLRAGSGTIITDGTTYGTDADGRYKQASTGSQVWTIPEYGPEYTILHIVKRVDNGANQQLSSSDTNPPRTFQFFHAASGDVQAILFRVTDTYAGTVSDTSTLISTTAPSAAIFRARNSSGTYYGNTAVDGTSSADTSFGGTPMSSTYLDLGGRVGGNLLSSSKLYFTAVWDRALTADEMTTLGANPWAIFDDVASGASAAFTVTIADATFSGAGEVRPMASFAVTSDVATFSGSAAAITSANISATTSNSAFSGSATGDTTAGTLTTPALKNNTGTVLANETGITAYIYTPDTGALVVKKTGQTTNASGVMSVTDAAIAASTQYRVVIVLGSGAEGMDKLTAS